VLTLLCLGAALRRRGRGLDPQKLAAATAHVASPDQALIWEPHARCSADRRGALRRGGQPVRVTLAADTFRHGVADGYVIDRSTGGLKIAAQIAAAVGPVTLVVRSCREADGHYELGCEFDKAPPWNVLLLFG
jgi:hypothetical protein